MVGISEIFSFGSKVIERMWPDPKEAAIAKLKMLEMQQAGEFKELEVTLELAKGQMEINKTEATNPNWFISGWRPYIGWICGTGLAYQFLIYPILISYLPTIQSLDMGTLLTLLLGMLGLGGMRTYEKSKGAEGNRS